MRDAFDEFMDELRRRRAAIDGSDDAGETGSNGESNAETGARDKTSGGKAREDETVDTNRSGPGTDGDPEGEDETPRPISRGGFGVGFGGGRRTRGMGPSDDFPQINISRRWVVLFIAIIVAFSLITTFFTVGIQLTTDAIWYQSIGFAGTSDSVFAGTSFLNGTQQQLTTTYGMRGAFNHNWDPYWSSSLWGSYAAVRYNGSATDILSAKGQFCASFNFGKAVSADYSCNPDFNVAQVGLTTRWTPVKNLTFSAEVGAFFLDQKFTGSITNLAAAAPKPTTVYEFKDQSTVFLNVRAQRNF